jgi:hypothetical protein
VLEDFGEYGEYQWLVEATPPMTGTFQDIGLGYGYIDIDVPSSPVDRTVILTPAIRDALLMTHDANEFHLPEGEIGADIHSFIATRAYVLWRDEGSGDPWTVIDGLRKARNVIPPDSVTIPSTMIEAAVNRTDADSNTVIVISRIYTGAFLFGDNVWPTDNQAVEFLVVYKGPASEAFPYHVEGLTAGELLKNLYDGVYSPRDPVTNEIVPTGIRYDEDALMEMTTIVRVRVTEPVRDIRRWAEKNVYAPLGYAPALDFDGRISPVSQIIPTDPEFLLSLVTIDNAISQAVPGHAPGENVINVLNFKYGRAYVHEDSEASDGLVIREIEYEYRDELSIYRHGDRELPIETVALIGVGNEDGDAVESEVGAEMFEERQLNMVENRRVNGTDLAVVPVMRDPLLGTTELRAGSWVRCRLSWLPNGATQRRSLNHLAQILAIKDLNCSWRELTMELVQPWPLSDDDYS